MAIAFDAASGTIAAGTNTSTLTFSHAVGTGENRLLIVSGNGNQGPTASVTATYNGVSMTEIAYSQDNTGTGMRTYIWYMLDPPSGAHNVVLSSSTNTVVGGAVSYSGVSQISLINAQNNTALNTTTTSISKSLTSTQANSWVIMGVRCGSGLTITGGTDTTVRVQSDSTYLGGGIIVDSNGTNLGTATKTLAFTSSSQYYGGQVIVSISPTPSTKELYSTPLYSHANLVAYWRMSDTSDSKGSYTLTNNGTTTFTSGIFGNAGTFNGTSQYLNNTSVNWGSGTSWSASLWVKATAGASAYRRWFGNNNGALASNDIILREDGANGGVQLLVNNGSGNSTNTSFAYKGGWHHFAIVSNGTTTKVYGDGAEIISVNAVSTPFDGVFIGGYYTVGPAEYFAGQIDDVAIFDGVITPFQIQSLYSGLSPTELNSTPLASDASTVAYYRFSDATDSHGNTYPGTATNVTYSAGVFGNAAILAAGRINLPAGTWFPYKTNMTLAGWFQLPSTWSAGTDFIFGLDSNTGGASWDYFEISMNANGTFKWRETSSVGGDTTVTSSVALSKSLWYHLAFTKTSAGAAIIYINGMSVATGSMPMNWSSASTVDGGFGTFSWPTTPYNATHNYDDWIVLSRVLTPEEVIKVYSGVGWSAIKNFGSITYEQTKSFGPLAVASVKNYNGV
jgi:hypothetical protein